MVSLPKWPTSPASAIDIFLAPNPILFIDALAVASIAILTDRNGSPFPGQKGVGGEVVRWPISAAHAVRICLVAVKKTDYLPLPV